MGYLVNGRYVEVTGYTTQVELEIMDEIKVVYTHRFGRRFTEDKFNMLSSQEQNDVIHQAGIRVQDKRRGRLIV